MFGGAERRFSEELSQWPDANYFLQFVSETALIPDTQIRKYTATIQNAFPTSEKISAVPLPINLHAIKYAARPIPKITFEAIFITTFKPKMRRGSQDVFDLISTNRRAIYRLR
jgi:hypothetical protein